ncbi:MAG: hypothetical protein ACRDFR_06900 [Candidatus Limnocylindria bacterium]
MAAVTEVREFLVETFGAQPRRSWGLDALYHRGRLFVLFDGGDIVGKWPPQLRSKLRARIPGVRAFMDEGDSPDATWLRVPLASVSPARAIDLALTAADYVQTPEGAPKRRHVSSGR